MFKKSLVLGFCFLSCGEFKKKRLCVKRRWTTFAPPAKVRYLDEAGRVGGMSSGGDLGGPCNRPRTGGGGGGVVGTCFFFGGFLTWPMAEL